MQDSFGWEGPEQGPRTYVLGVDPGTTTGLGLALFQRPRCWLCWHAELPWDEAADALEARLRDLAALQKQEGIEAVAVGEQFTINAKTHMRGQATAEDAMFMLGVLRRETRRVRVPQAPLQQTSVKNTANDLVMRALGLYVPGRGHATDALRHAVVLALKRGLVGGEQLRGAL